MASDPPVTKQPPSEALAKVLADAKAGVSTMQKAWIEGTSAALDNQGTALERTKGTLVFENIAAHLTPALVNEVSAAKDGGLPNTEDLIAAATKQVGDELKAAVDAVRKKAGKGRG